MNPWSNTPHVVDVGMFVPPLSGLPIDNPLFRFWDTIGYFGIGVYIWIVLRWKSLAKSDFLSASMIIPFFTNLNPFFAVLYLHFGPATGLWRTAYLIPSGIMAATLFTLVFLSSPIQKQIRPRWTDYLLVTALILSLAPLHYQNHFNRTSRLPSLLPVYESSGSGLWSDVIHAITEIQAERDIRRIITDSVTKFVLYSATRNQIWPWAHNSYFPKHINDYKEDFLTSDFTQSLLVINKRNGRLTNSARYAGHWPPNTLKVSQNYPQDLDDFIATYPDKFELLWSATDIKIFLMHPFND